MTLKEQYRQLKKGTIVHWYKYKGIEEYRMLVDEKVYDGIFFDLFNPENNHFVCNIKIHATTILSHLSDNSFVIIGRDIINEDRYPHTCEYCGHRCWNGAIFDCSNTNCLTKG